MFLYSEQLRAGQVEGTFHEDIKLSLAYLLRGSANVVRKTVLNLIIKIILILQ